MAEIIDFDDSYQADPRFDSWSVTIDKQTAMSQSLGIGWTIKDGQIRPIQWLENQQAWLMPADFSECEWSVEFERVEDG